MLDKKSEPVALTGSILIDALISVGVVNIGQALEWAFGPNYQSLSLDQLAKEWNERRGYLKIIEPFGDVYHDMQEIGILYKKSFH